MSAHRKYTIRWWLVCLIVGVVVGATGLVWLQHRPEPASGYSKSSDNQGSPAPLRQETSEGIRPKDKEAKDAVMAPQQKLLESRSDLPPRSDPKVAYLPLPHEGAGAADPPGKADKGAERLKALREERLAAAREELRLLTELQKGGSVDSLPILYASDRVLRATLDLTDKKADRIAAWTDHIARLKAREADIKRVTDAGAGRDAEYFLAKYERLGAEIELEFERSRPEPPDS